MSKYVELTGVIQINEEMSNDEFFDKFIDFVEANGWFYGGSMKEFDADAEEEVYEVMVTRPAEYKKPEFLKD